VTERSTFTESDRSGPPGADVARRAFAAQVEGIYAKLPFAVLSHVPTGAAVAWLLRHGQAPWLVAGWLGVLWALVVARLLLLRRYRAVGSALPAEGWARRTVLGTLASGLVWGAGLAALLPGAALPERLAVYAILAGMVAGSAGTLGDLLGAFTAFEVPVALPVLAVTATSPDPIERLLAPLVLAYAVAIWLVARRAGRSLETALTMRFRNEALVEGLAAARAHLEGLNAALEGQVRERTERLVRAERELAQASMLASVGSLAAGVAHDVNSPLSGVLSNLAWLERELQEGDRPPDRAGLLEAVAETQEAARRVRDAVRHLSSVARGDSTPEAVDAAELLEACANVTTPAFLRRARLVRALPRLPPVLADRPGLAQVFLSLLQRAARAFPEGGPEGLVRISGRLEGGEVVLELADDGVALRPEEAARLAGSAFGAGDPGLVVCHETVARLGGTLAARSGEGGTVVTVRLPAAAPKAS